MSKKIINTIPKNKSVSRNICDKSNTYITLLTKTNHNNTNNTNNNNKNTKSNNKNNNTPYNKYKTYIKTISNKFINSQNNLLSNLFHIKDNTSFTVSYTEELLSNSSNSGGSIYSIPKFIDLFRYLITVNAFITQFTLEDQNTLKDNLSIEKTKKQCYSFLDKSLLGNKIISVYTSINHLLTNDTQFKTKFPSLDFHNLLINSFTSYKILEDLELNIKKLVKYSINWKGKSNTNFVYLFMYDKEKSTNSYSYTPDQLNKIGTEIVKRILFFNIFLNSNVYPDKFIIFITDNKKEIDKELVEEAHFKTINVNTAVTNSKDIIIYREQELFKSIFHELIHFHNLDFRNISNTILSKIINYLTITHNINKNNKYLLYECITETLANILNNIYYSGSIKEFNTNLQDEIMFSTLQVCKILHICKYKKWSDFSLHSIHSSIIPSHNKTDKHSKYPTHPKQFKQDSCVFSYYILKLYILLNIDIYFKTILDNKMKFIQTETSFNKLIEIFDASRKNSILENIINHILQGLNSKNKYKYKNKNKTKTNKINKTLRMTCLESNLFNKNAI